MTNAARIEAAPLSEGQPLDPPGRDVAEHLARIGVRVGAQRVELYRCAADAAELRAWWGALGHGQDRPELDGSIPEAWFPWSLGNIRPLESLFVQNAASLAIAPGGPSLGEVGYASVLHLPVFDEHQLIGAACSYWVDERLDWPQEARHQLAEWARSALDRLPVTT